VSLYRGHYPQLSTGANGLGRSGLGRFPRCIGKTDVGPVAAGGYCVPSPFPPPRRWQREATCVPKPLLSACDARSGTLSSALAAAQAGTPPGQRRVVGREFVTVAAAGKDSAVAQRRKMSMNSGVLEIQLRPPLPQSPTFWPHLRQRYKRAAKLRSVHARRRARALPTAASPSVRAPTGSARRAVGRPAMRRSPNRGPKFASAERNTAVEQRAAVGVPVAQRDAE
jgi:hypothetical protein